MNAKRLIKQLSRADLAFYLLPPIMLELFAGTVAQRTLGLYTAQKIFFANPILWLGPLPLPGFYTLTALLTLSLLAKFLTASDWTLKKAGIHLTHLGVLVLLIGGLATAITAREGYIILPEGGSSPYVYDYHQRDLFIFRGDNLILTAPFEKLEQLKLPRLPFAIKTLAKCANCDIAKRAETGTATQGMARFMQLSPKPAEKEPEQNIAGATLEITGTKKQDGTYIVFEGMPKPIEIGDYKIIFGREQRLLPFGIRLDKFTKENYPGTDKPRGYSSDISVLDGALSWPARIEMNKPLRYKGYTLYQSSFEQTPQGQFSVLSVVENKGRLFPYIGTALIAAGLLLHLLMMLREKKI